MKTSIKSIYRIVRKKIKGKRSLPKQMMRPFRQDDMTPVPPDWIIGAPDFIGVGSAKSGTSWWYSLLLSHPSVKPNRLAAKELTYFTHFGYNDISPEAIETYRQAFARPRECICGEWSPGYITYPFASNYLAKAAPQAKVLVIVRNPVDRTVSSMNQTLTVLAPEMNLDREGRFIFERYSVFPHKVLHSLLYDPFRRLLSLYDRSQILVLQYEKCKLDPVSEITKTFRFLGVDDSFVPPDLKRKVNAKPHDIPPLTPVNRKILTNYFRDDVMMFVSDFPEIDLTLWRDFVS